jgi:RNA polymerase sigma factor (sigma-70 family)
MRSGTQRAAGGTGVGDIGELYGRLSRRLEQLVRLDVRAQDVVIEDACQFAWSRLVHHRGRVRRDATLSWLARTAVHEAVKQVRRDGRELSLEATVESGGDAVVRLRTPAPDDVVTARERLAQVELLPERQRRLLWMQGVGLSYSEMSARTGATQRTVERQLIRARQTVRGFELE